MASDLCSVIATVQELVKQKLTLRKSLSASNQRRFATDLALVGYRIRTGYLVDLLSANNPVSLFSGLLDSLRSNYRTKSYFTHVVHLYEPTSDQSFFVNTALLAPLIQTFVCDAGEPAEKSSLTIAGLDHTFIHFQTPFEILGGVPSQVLWTLNSLLPLLALRDRPLSYSLPADISLQTAVSLAAILLDYPVAYVPSSSQGNNVSNVPLDFYECLLTFGGKVESQKHECTIMKFSSPAELGKGRGRRLHPDMMIQMLQDTFSSRLEQIGEPSMRVTIQHTTQIIEHVVI